ncbi:MAG: protein TolQ [Betaproteobacteria bacterium]|nr:protein TolQ [Betaproteobacteria bacterium]
MTGNSDLSILSLVLEASIVVKLVIALLLGVSLISWYWIFRKSISIRDAQRRTAKFEGNFWGGGDMGTLYRNATAEMDKAGPQGRIFVAGYREFAKLRGQNNLDASDIINGARRAMRATMQREVDDLEAHTAFLATAGSVSPYVGLFGTVWGIMHAFRGLGDVGSATLGQVAPGIAEALVATAIGLFAAIPAVVAYNRFAHNIDRLTTRYESFMEEFSNILQRQLR